MTNNSAAQTNGKAPLPPAIDGVLQQIIRRRRTIVLLRGIFAVAAVAIASLLVVMALDAVVTILSPVVRWSLTGGALLLTAAAAWWFLVRPLSRPMTLRRAAELVDAHHPEFEERVSSAVELLTSHDVHSSPASEALVAELAKQAVETVGAVEPRRELSLRVARPYVIAGSIALVVLAAIWILWPTQTSRLFARAVATYTEPADEAGEFLAVKPGDTVLRIGSNLDVKASVKGIRARSVRLVTSDADGEPLSRPMNRQPVGERSGAREFSLPLGAIDKDFRYKVIVDGHVQSPEYSVSVTSTPAVTKYDLVYDYPEYTALPQHAETDAAGDMEAPAGTIVRLSATFNKPLKTAELYVDGKPYTADNGKADGLDANDPSRATWRIALLPKMSTKWRLRLKDEAGFTQETEPHSIRALSDLPPTVAFLDPDPAKVDMNLKALRLHPTDQLPISYRAGDDWGIESAALVVEFSPGKEEVIAIGRPRESDVVGGQWFGQAVLDLGELPISNGTRLNVYVQVKDALPEMLGGPQQARSQPLPLYFDQNSPRYAQQYAESKLNLVNQGLGKAINHLRSAKGQVTGMLPLVEKEPLSLNEPTRRTLKGALTNTSTAEAALRQVGEEDALPDFPEVAQGALDVTDEHVRPARQALELVTLAVQKSEQVELLKKTDAHLDAAIEAVQKLIDASHAERENIIRKRELAADIGDLADEQARLREATEKALEQPSPEEIAAELARRLTEAQRQIHADAVNWMRDVDASGFNASDDHRQATESARVTAGELAGKRMEQASARGKQAAEQFDKAAKKLKENPPSQERPPGATPLDERGERLAKRQKNLNDALEALKKGDIAASLEAMQRDVAERSEQLAADNERMRKEAGKLGTKPNSKGPSASPSSDLDSAAEKAQQAAQKLAHINNIPKISPPKFLDGPQSPSDNGGNPDGGQGTKGGGSNTGAGNSKNPSPSNNNQNNTIGKGKNLGKATLTAEALLNQKPSQQNVLSGGSGTELQADAEELLRKGLATIMADNNPLAKGFGGFGGGPTDENVPPSPPREFAAQQTGQNPDSPNGSQRSGGQPGGVKPGQGATLSAGGAAVIDRLGALGISGDEWLSLPSELRNEMLQSADDRTPRAYRELVRRYFRELARRGAEETK